MLDVETRQFELVQELADNVELPVQSDHRIRLSQGEISWNSSLKKVTRNWVLAKSGPFPADWSVAKWDGKKLGKRLKN